MQQISFYYFFLCFLAFQGISLYSSDTLTTKKRLTETINAYQPTILPVISPSGTRLYFDRKEHPEDVGGIYDSDDIWYSDKNELGHWCTPVHIKQPLNSKASDALLSIFADGTKALVYGEYDSLGNKNQGFSIVDIVDDKLSENITPLKIKNFYNNSANYSAQISCDSKHLLLSIQNNDSKGLLDLYVSHWNENEQIWSEPTSLGPNVNTPDIETSPFLSNDLKTLYFASSGLGGYGKLDLFMTKRLDETWTNWSKPENLGPTINSFGDESSFSLTLKNDSIYFVSNDLHSLRPGIYVAEIPYSLRPNPFSIHSGFVRGIDFKEIERVHKNQYLEQLKNIENASKTIFIPFKNKSNFTSKVQFTVNSELVEKYIHISPTGSFKTIFPFKIQSPLTLIVNNKRVDSFKLSSEFYTQKELISFSFSPQESFRCIILALYFENNSDSLISNQIKDLSKLAEYVQGFIDSSMLNSNFLRFKVIGHTDEKGNNRYNKQLSVKRATAVATTFQELLSSKCLIENTGNGCDFPVEVNGNVSNSKNRRVEIYLEYSVPNNEYKTSLK